MTQIGGSVTHTEILEWGKQHIINSLRQTQLGCNTLIEVRQVHTISTLRCCRKTYQNLWCEQVEHLLITHSLTMMSLVYNDVVVVVGSTPAECIKIGIERLDGNKQMTQISSC